jgi:hypothetical protein
VARTELDNRVREAAFVRFERVIFSRSTRFGAGDAARWMWWLVENRCGRVREMPQRLAVTGRDRVAT